MSTFVYNAEAQLNDGSAILLDLEKTGWADPEMLAKTTRFTLLPKEGALTMKGLPYPIVVVNIPEGGKPVYRSRVFRKAAGAENAIDFRAYCIGYKADGVVHWTWVLPTGDVETGTDDDSYLAMLLFTHLEREYYRQRDEYLAAQAG